MLRIEACAINHKGFIRKNNEDNYYLDGSYLSLEHADEPSCLVKFLNDANAVIAAVCDGMGGAQAGEEAAYSVVTSLEKSMVGKNLVREKERMAHELCVISRHVYELRTQRNVGIMGTTIVLACIEKGHLLVSNVGDSRAYLMRRGELKQISEDHSEVQRMVNMGLISREMMKMHPRRHIITQYMGVSDKELLIVPFFSDVIELCGGDRILLCSDGVTDMLEDETIAEILRSENVCEQAAQLLISEVLNCGGTDNATVILLQIMSDEEEKSE